MIIMAREAKGKKEVPALFDCNHIFINEDGLIEFQLKGSNDCYVSIICISEKDFNEKIGSQIIKWEGTDLLKNYVFEKKA